MNAQRPAASPPEWGALFESAGVLPTQSPAWNEAALAAFGGKPRLVSVGEAADVEGVAPLVLHGSTLELAAGREVSEPGDLLYSSEGALEALGREIAELRRPLLLRRVPAASATVPALREALGRRARVRLEEAEGHPTITLGERWQEPGGGLSSSRRSSLRRARRKAEQMGEVGIQLLSPAPGEVDPLLDIAFAVEARSWKGKTGTAIALVPSMEAFFRDFAKRIAAAGLLRLDLLRIGGEPVAMQLGMAWRNRHWLFKIGYDESFSSASPGQILIGESVAAAARAGLEGYELLGSRDPWTDVWTKDVNECVKVLVLPASPRSALALAAIGRRGVRRRGTALAQEVREKMWEAAISRYVAGAELESALAEEERCASAGYLTTVGFWNTAATPKEVVVKEANEAAGALPPGSEVSVKLPSMGGDTAALDDLFSACRERDLTLHLDAIRPDSAQANQDAAVRLAGVSPGAVGCTLASRWARSAADAREIAAKAVRVRIVKGEFEDAEEVEPRAGYLEIARALGGRSHLVEVATQDAALAKVALEALVADQTPCELQVLHGMRCARAVAVAKKLGVPVRVYIPYGKGRLPYRRAQLRRSPATLFRLATDLLPLPPRRAPGA